MATILAPRNTNANVRPEYFAVYTTTNNVWTATIGLFLQTSAPSVNTRWTGVSLPAGVTVSFSPGASNPYQLYQLATISGTGTPPASVQISAGGATATVLLVASAITLSPACPIAALSASSTNPAVVQLNAALSNLTGTLTQSSWSVGSATITAHAADWTSVTLSFLSSLYAGPAPSQVVSVSLTVGGTTHSAQTTVYLAPVGTTPSNIAFAYDKAGSFYGAQSATTWTAAPPTTSWGSVVPSPALRVLEMGAYNANLLDDPRFDGGVACYVMNFNVFGTLTGAS